MDGRERRARLSQRHHLAPDARAAGPTEVARSLVALHATDPASVFLACLARTDGDTASVERALYEEHSLVRMLGMRRTVFVVPVEIAPILQAGCTRAIAVQERRKLIQSLEQAGVARDGASWLADVEAQTMAALTERGEALGQELSQAVAALRTQISYGDETKKWAATSAVTSRILFVMAAEGRIVRGRPRGSWISSQHRWAPREAWLALDDELATSVARVELARRWLAAYGPATAADLKWWTGWTLGETRKALADLHPVEVELVEAGPGGASGLVLPGDAVLVGSDHDSGGEPWAALLPALDSTVMGWAERAWFLGDQVQRARLFDRSGNAGPTVWWDGRVVGGWAQRKDGEIAVGLLQDVGADAAAAITHVADRLSRLIGEVRVTPRFRTPLERELAG